MSMRFYRLFVISWIFLVNIDRIIAANLKAIEEFPLFIEFGDEAERPTLEFDRTDVTIKLGDTSVFRMRSSQPLNSSVNITFWFTTKADSISVELRRPTVVIPNGDNATEWIDVELKAVNVGHDCVLHANCSNFSEPFCDLNTDDSTLRIVVVHSIPMVTFIQVVGWIYFVAWSISFYPQIWLNFRRKRYIGNSPRQLRDENTRKIQKHNVLHLMTVSARSHNMDVFSSESFQLETFKCCTAIRTYTKMILWLLIINLFIGVTSVTGLNFDFLALNASGFLFYSLYNVALFWIPVVQNEYADALPDSVNPVQLNDVIFALHALFATLITIVQCIYYPKAEQRVSRICCGLLGIIWFLAILCVVLAGAKVFNWLTFFNILSGTKLAITLIKYIPQAFYNYRRKSTVGWSIGNVLLDFTGGSMSIIQMFLIAYNNDDWKEIFGDFTKFGLGLISLLFDLLFITQHYVLYRGAVGYERQESDLDDDVNVRTPSVHVPYVENNDRH